MNWTQEHDAVLHEGKERGLSLEQIARKIGVKRGSVAARWHRLSHKGWLSPRAQRRRKLRWRIRLWEKRITEWRAELAELNEAN